MEKEIFKPAVPDQGGDFHLLPCRIDFEGETNVKKYFVIKDKTSSIRGRGLKGQDLDLDHRIVLIRKVGEKWKLAKKSSKTTVWCHDQSPSKESCSLLNSRAWIQLSNAIHGIGGQASLNK